MKHKGVGQRKGTVVRDEVEEGRGQLERQERIGLRERRGG
jgi:hypothetical protein